MRLIFLRRVFSGLMPFSVFHQFSCFSRRFLFIYMGFFSSTSSFLRLLLTLPIAFNSRHASILSELLKITFQRVFLFLLGCLMKLEHGGRFLLSYRSLERWQDCRDNSPKSFNMLGLRCFVYFPLFLFSPSIWYWNGTTLLRPPLRKWPLSSYWFGTMCTSGF